MALDPTLGSFLAGPPLLVPALRPHSFRFPLLHPALRPHSIRFPLLHPTLDRLWKPGVMIKQHTSRYHEELLSHTFCLAFPGDGCLPSSHLTLLLSHTFCLAFPGDGCLPSSHLSLLIMSCLIWQLELSCA